MNLRDLPDMSSAYKQVQEKNDGNLANNAPPYDKVTRRDVITGALGKDEMGGKRKKHDCAKKVNYKKEEYDCIPEQHTMLEDGTVTHYDITNGEVILENVPVEDLEILISEKHEHFDNYDKNAEMLEGYGKKKKMKKEAFYFSDEEIADMVEIDEATDEELVDFFVEMIQELAEDEDDLLEICEALEEVEMLTEVSDKYYDSAVKSSKAAAKANRPSRRERMMSAAKKAGSSIKKGVKAAGKSVARNAGKAVGEFQAARIKQKRAAMSRPEKKKETSSSSSSSSSSSDDDGTGGKLDALLSKTRGTSSSSSSSSSGGGGSSSSGGKKKPGLLRRIGGAVKRGLKKAVGKTARAVSSGSGKLAKRLGEDYDKIAHLYESGLFTIQEIENVIEEGYKEIDRPKENRMYRRAGNLARTGLSSKGKKKEDALKKSEKIVSAISRQKEKERFSKMADIKARDNYGG